MSGVSWFVSGKNECGRSAVKNSGGIADNLAVVPGNIAAGSVFQVLRRVAPSARARTLLRASGPAPQPRTCGRPYPPAAPPGSNPPMRSTTRISKPSASSGRGMRQVAAGTIRALRLSRVHAKPRQFPAGNLVLRPITTATTITFSKPPEERQVHLERVLGAVK